MNVSIIVIFILGYLAIAFENFIKINKAASALVTGVLCWTVYILFANDTKAVHQQLQNHTGDIAAILFFLLGAMTIVELIDAHDGFELVKSRIRTVHKRKLLWLVSLFAFFLSAVLDNLTTAIVMISLVRKLIPDKNTRLLFCGMIVIATNAGGAWSPIGDVTTTMLWMGGQISSAQIVTKVFLPSIACLGVPLILMSFQMRGILELGVVEDTQNSSIPTSVRERNIVFFTGIAILLAVPVFKTFTNLPPFMGMLLGLGLMWIITEIIHSGKDNADKNFLSVLYALRKIDSPTILFFLGILLSVACLESVGSLGKLATLLEQAIGNETMIVGVIGLLSSIVDNVPLVAAAMGMYGLEQYPMDYSFWLFLSYCAGTGGSILIIGSAAGVAAMGIEKIEFFWYARKIGWLALLGFLAGILVFLMQKNLFSF